MDNTIKIYCNKDRIDFFYDIILSLVFSILVGLGFEIYQGYSKKHNGYSHTDMIYNISGAIIAFILHNIIKWIRKYQTLYCI